MTGYFNGSIIIGVLALGREVCGAPGSVYIIK
jgi:hypothetical protein